MYLLGALVGFVVMRFGFGPASASMHLRPEYDLNIYYLIGQGWFQGDIPYRDLTDLKGPVVFLLHGIGACMTPGSFLGACLVESLLLGVGVLYAYRSVRLFFSVSVSLAVLGIYSVSLLYFSLHPAEMVWVLQHVAVFYLLRWSRGNELPGLRQQLILGLSAGVVLLIKFNLVAFWLPFCLWGVLVAGRNWWRALSVQLAGVSIPLLLAGLYFYQQSALDDLWREYVVLALQYGGCAWSESAMTVRGWLLASEMVPLHLHQSIPKTLAACLGWLSLLPCVFLPQILKPRTRAVVMGVLAVAFVLQLFASYGGSRCFIHYAFVFYPYWLLGLLVLANKLGRVTIWAGSCALPGVLSFAVGLPLAVKCLKPDNGNAEMNQASDALATMVSGAHDADLLVLDVEHALHLYRLSGKRPGSQHFIPAMVPGGMEQHLAELETEIRKRNPRYVLSTAARTSRDAELLKRIPCDYRACRHAELGLPAFPSQAKRPEFVLYKGEE